MRRAMGNSRVVARTSPVRVEQPDRIDVVRSLVQGDQEFVQGCRILDLVPWLVADAVVDPIEDHLLRLEDLFGFLPEHPERAPRARLGETKFLLPYLLSGERQEQQWNQPAQGRQHAQKQHVPTHSGNLAQERSAVVGAAPQHRPSSLHSRRPCGALPSTPVPSQAHVTYRFTASGSLMYINSLAGATRTLIFSFSRTTASRSCFPLSGLRSQLSLAHGRRLQSL